ncbi:MAG: hypothetical protein EBT34_09255 [Acetobacteraceae bacterium]|nr:hypothetical protein [Acetobacteraceae bacterium]
MRRILRGASRARVGTMLRFLILARLLVATDFREASHAFPIQATNLGEDWVFLRMLRNGQ